MNSDDRIPLVKHLYAAGKIQTFADVFLFVPLSPLAIFASIPRSRLRKLSCLSMKDIIACSKLLSIPTQTLFNWACQATSLQQETGYSISNSDALKIDIISDRIALGKLQYFSQLFDIIPRTTVAGLLRLNNDRVAEMIFQPDTINVKTMIRFAHFFKNEPAILFQLIENEWLAKAKIPINKIKPTIRLVRSKMTA